MSETVKPKKIHLDTTSDKKLSKLAKRFACSRSEIVRRLIANESEGKI